MSSGTAADLATRIDDLLPQTQCTRCGYTGCRPYAEAIAMGDAEINQCPPGGQATIDALASLLERAPLKLNPANGLEAPAQVAFIDESRCIGCARCLAPCPVDAIVGAAKFMHTVFAERCTGCELCLAPCPVDCIEMRPTASAANDPTLNRARFAAHAARLANRTAQRQRLLDAKKAAVRRAESP
jgi:Na+-translocating ferredoxin:NAD+ oxidoreductase subunit B